LAFLRDNRGGQHRDRTTMKGSVVLVAAALTVAILLAASLLIATETRGETAGPAVREHAAPVTE
jgi:hypothetical protein